MDTCIVCHWLTKTEMEKDCKFLWMYSVQIKIEYISKVGKPDQFSYI